MLRMTLQPKQGKLLSLLQATGAEAATTIGFGGAKGGGKSAGVRNCALTIANELGIKYPGVTVTVIRRVYNDLKTNHIDELFAAHPELRQHYREADKEVAIPGRGRIVFAFAETPGDVERKFRGGYQSAFILVDEAQQFTEAELQDFKMACRWTKHDAGLPLNFCKLVLLFNPGGKSADYLRRIFWTRQYTTREKPASYTFMHVFGWDNYEWFRGQVDVREDEFYLLSSEVRYRMFITQTSEGVKYDQMPDSIRKGYLLGSFDHFEGQYFAGVWDERKCIITKAKAEALIQPWWTRWMAQDWAFAEHAAHGWFASGKLSPSQWMEHFGGKIEWPMDVVILYRTHVISNRAEADLATDIVTMTPQDERKSISRFFLSQDAFGQHSRQGVAHSIGETFQKVLTRYGMPSPEPASQERVVGWRFMYNCLRQANLVGTNVSEERARQGPAFFVSAECPEVIQSIPMAIRAEDDLDDVERVDGALWEDCCDMARYGLHSQLNAKTKASKDVRAKELLHSIQGDDLASVMTERAIVMKQFEIAESSETRVSRGGRWRD